MTLQRVPPAQHFCFKYLAILPNKLPPTDPTLLIPCLSVGVSLGREQGFCARSSAPGKVCVAGVLPSPTSSSATSMMPYPIDVVILPPLEERGEWRAWRHYHQPGRDKWRAVHDNQRAGRYDRRARQHDRRTGQHSRRQT